MIRLSTNLLLACLMLLSQAALGSHDVQHLGSAHNELCAVYLSQDHSAPCIAVSVPPTFLLVFECFQIELERASIAVSTYAYASRAPPIA